MGMSADGLEKSLKNARSMVNPTIIPKFMFNVVALKDAQGFPVLGMAFRDDEDDEEPVIFVTTPEQAVQFADNIIKMAIEMEKEMGNGKAKT